MLKTALGLNAMAILFDSSISAWPSRFGGADDRHLVFVSQDFDMHLKISETKGKNALHGQVIPHGSNKDPESSTITLLAEGELVGKSATDGLGEFSLTDVPHGDLVVEVTTSNRRITASFSV